MLEFIKLLVLMLLFILYQVAIYMPSFILTKQEMAYLLSTLIWYQLRINFSSIIMVETNSTLQPPSSRAPDGSSSTTNTLL